MFGLACGVGYQPDRSKMVAVEIADFRRAACINNAEVGVGLQDELLIRATKIAYLRHARVEGFHPADGLPLPRPSETYDRKTEPTVLAA